MHQCPERSWEEHRTAELVRDALADLGIKTRTVAGTGLVADLPGPDGMPVVALRADMDALPVQEETGLPYASDRPGLMHACGHDGHTSALVGAAALLARESALPAPVRLVFQPAEEIGEGAAALIAAGALDGVAFVFAGHVDVGFTTGTIVAADGTVNASTDEFTIEISGPGGHAARPHESVDTIVVASHVVSSLQTVVSRRVPPDRDAVITIGRFHAGTAVNVLASSAVLEGTLRARDAETRALLRTAVHEVATATATAHGAVATVALHDGTPPVVNHPAATALARAAAAQVVGVEHVVRTPLTNMGGEDFGFYGERAPGAFVRFGARPSGAAPAPAHSGRFEFDEQALAVAAAFLHRVALETGHALRTGTATDFTRAPGEA
jgi:hippurate hydrolase